MKFAKVKFGQSTELAGVGYSSVGGPERDGVYHSVPVEALENDYAKLLHTDGLLTILGEGEVPHAQEQIDDKQQAAFKASGLTEVQWLLLPAVERQALVDAEADRKGRQDADDLQAKLAAASKKAAETKATAHASTQTAESSQTPKAEEKAAPVAKKTAAPAKKTGAKGK